ncbi:hypothetical protein D9619_003503 [Psilocybe cf. subviscida]|uniref:Uncharacterized protein n=1 Tax=Psilocybe cf. subviscida TaxID=2480587 RepID=A0A8H5AWA1_9AGAR|nr:hypothetical protein D9619_003503 [Psilocybe cf. subviscida]
MTEYDYSPEAYDRFLATQDRIAKWVDTTERHRPEFQAPFGPNGRQQEQPPAESSSSGAYPIPTRHRDEKEHRSRRHHGDHESLETGSLNSREHGSGHGHASRSLPHATGYPHHQYQQYPPVQLQQQYASPHVQIYGAPGAVHYPQQPMHASHSYAGANSPPSYGYHSPPLPSAGHLSPKDSKSKKSKRSHSHQPASAVAAALAAYYSGAGYIPPPGAHGYHQHAYPSPVPVTGGRHGKGGYVVVDHPYQQSGVPQAQYPPVVPMMYRTR